VVVYISNIILSARTILFIILLRFKVGYTFNKTIQYTSFSQGISITTVFESPNPCLKLQCITFSAQFVQWT